MLLQVGGTWVDGKIDKISAKISKDAASVAIFTGYEKLRQDLNVSLILTTRSGIKTSYPQ
jgi:hypothetical protein